MVLALILAVVLAAGFVAGPGADRPAQSPRIAIVVLENHGYGEVVGSPEMPFFNGLAKRGALATRYRAITHPSLPNYLALKRLTAALDHYSLLATVEDAFGLPRLRGARGARTLAGALR